MIQPARVGLIMCTQGCFGVREAQTCLGYSMEDLDPNLFICGLPCNPTSKAPSSNQSVQVVSFSKKPLFDLHTSLFFVVLLPLCLLTLPSILCVLPPFLMSTSISCVFAVFLPTSFPMFSQYFSQCFSANPLFSFFSLFYSLSLVGHSSLSFDQFTHIFTFAKIPKESSCFLTILLKLVLNAK